MTKNMADNDRKKAALIRLRKLLPAFGRKLDHNTRRLSLHDDPMSCEPSFAALADEVVKFLGPP
jgi:hypothetical protein